jgi:hypothetical protein
MRGILRSKRLALYPNHYSARGMMHCSSAHWQRCGWTYQCLRRSRTFAGKARDRTLKKPAVESRHLNLPAAWPASRLWTRDCRCGPLEAAQVSSSITEKTLSRYLRKSFGVLLRARKMAFQKNGLTRQAFLSAFVFIHAVMPGSDLPGLLAMQECSRPPAPPQLEWQRRLIPSTDQARLNRTGLI